MKNETIYEDFYASLTELREHFHSQGRFDDSNSKLDELAKVLTISIAAAFSWIDSSEIDEILSMGSDNPDTASRLRQLFHRCTELPQYKNGDGTSLFGANPALNIHESDNRLAYLLLETSYCPIKESIRSGETEFDFLNEAFGHFVRDNFRNNVEDAQYMTPPEVVNFVCDWAIDEVEKTSRNGGSSFVVMDPSCGVGSFLTMFYSKAKGRGALPTQTIELVGQDKVERMIRLSKINMLLSGSPLVSLDCANSLVGESGLDSLRGKVDLILTNPPFGAKIDSSQIRDSNYDGYDLLKEEINSGMLIDSELLFIDREVSLLKEGGKLFIVVPDSVISSQGLSETLRARLSEEVTLRGIVELPAVTFAQAGTRTKTSILYIEKGRRQQSSNDLILAKAESLGFEVSQRKGVTIKRSEGQNDLLKIFTAMKSEMATEILSHSPSCVRLPEEKIIKGSWTASHYDARRIEAESRIKSMEECRPVTLKELVDFETRQRKRLQEPENSRCISILHIIGDGVLNFSELSSYTPKTKGVVCYPNDILFSKINPRIPRVIVVPEMDYPTTCSPEFEIMVAKEGVDPYFVAYMLQESLVQDQIQNLTSGTSSSHNRIKLRNLAEVLIPVPESDKAIAVFSKTIAEYKKATTTMMMANQNLSRIRKGSLAV